MYALVDAPAQWGDAPSLERNQLGALYVVFAVVFCSWILKNLFVAVIVQSYTRTHAQLRTPSRTQHTHSTP
jgi:hypothetical protein